MNVLNAKGYYVVKFRSFVDHFHRQNLPCYYIISNHELNV